MLFGGHVFSLVSDATCYARSFPPNAAKMKFDWKFDMGIYVLWATDEAAKQYDAVKHRQTGVIVDSAFF